MNNDITQLAVNAVMTDMQLRLGRQALAGGMGGDQKRPQAWREYGFPADITPEMMYSMWERNGIAFGAIAKVVGNCWKSTPIVIEGGEEQDDRKETQFDKAVAVLAKRLRLWSVLRRLTSAAWFAVTAR